MAAACAAMAIWLRPAPSTDHLYWSPNSRSAVRFMCSTSSGCVPMPPRMPNTVWMNSGGFTRPRSRKWCQVVEVGGVVAFELEPRAAVAAQRLQHVFDIREGVAEDQVAGRFAAPSPSQSCLNVLKRFSMGNRPKFIEPMLRRRLPAANVRCRSRCAHPPSYRASRRW